MSDHLARADLAGLAMLDRADPERVRAEAHADACPECRAELARAAEILAPIDALAPPPRPDPDALLRARDRIHAELAGPATDPGALVAIAALAAAGFGLPLVLLPRVGELPGLAILAASALVLGRVAIALLRGTAREGGMALAFVVGLSAILVALDAGDGGRGHGVNCALLEGITAFLPGVTAIALARFGKLAPSPVPIAAAAASGALAGQLALHALCGDRALEHLVPFHFGAVVAAALVAGIVSRATVSRAIRS